MFLASVYKTFEDLNPPNALHRRSPPAYHGISNPLTVNFEHKLILGADSLPFTNEPFPWLGDPGLENIGCYSPTIGQHASTSGDFLLFGDPVLDTSSRPPFPSSCEPYVSPGNRGFEDIKLFGSCGLISGEFETWSSSLVDPSGPHAAQPILPPPIPEFQLPLINSTSEGQQNTSVESAPTTQNSNSQGVDKAAKQRAICATCLGSHSRPVRYRECQNKASKKPQFKCDRICGNTSCTAKFYSKELLGRHTRPRDERRMRCNNW
ncbi:hypothetical protein SIIN_1667_T [Serendipita indica DSM 11827]|nr:hypothetical protein SIIN_1667_T [Serendipita indica DSM 11827]